MANSAKGEKEITLNGIKYNLKLTMSVIAEFQDMRNKCFMQCATRAVNAYAQTSRIEGVLERAEALTCAVELDDAATLFYLAAKEGNNQVQFAEMQEALIDDIDISTDARFYPALFSELCLFAVMGREYKKKVTASSTG